MKCKLLVPLVLLGGCFVFWWSMTYLKDPVCLSGTLADTDGLAGQVQQPPPPELLTTWRTDFGLLSLVGLPSSNGVEGFYYDKDTNQMEGMLRASYNDQILTGYWIQSTSKKLCSYKRHGSFYWGKLHFHFGEKWYYGKWGYCDEELNGSWNGWVAN